MKKLVMVEWVDSHYRPGWTTEVHKPLPVTCRSVGWLVKDGKKAKVLSANKTLEEVPQRCGDITIPTAAILSMNELQDCG